MGSFVSRLRYRARQARCAQGRASRRSRDRRPVRPREQDRSSERSSVATPSRRARSCGVQPSECRQRDRGRRFRRQFAYIAMELVNGRTLRTYIGDRATTMDRRISWLSQIAEGLEAAHLRGLVHRDVKPENVMVCTDGTVKLMDFGGVKKMEDEKPPNSTNHPTFVTRAGMVVGTPMYMVPGASDRRAASTVARIRFAWGTLAYELLCQLRNASHPHQQSQKSRAGVRGDSAASGSRSPKSRRRCRRKFARSSCAR